jgi:glucose/arabinose dehydrogenase
MRRRANRRNVPPRSRETRPISRGEAVDPLPCREAATIRGMRKWLRCGVLVVLVAFGASVAAQKPARAPSPPLPVLPVTLFTSELPVRVTAVATGLSHPWSLIFLPDSSASSGARGSTMLVTERAGRVRIIRHGVLDPKPVEGVPIVYNGRLAGLLDIALHPKFAENQLLYLSYSKVRPDKRSTTVLARARWTGTALADLKEIFVANTWSESETNFGGRIAFDRDGFLFLTIGERQEQNRAQDPGDHGGKVIRLKDDGSVPADNPFVGRAGHMPEIYSLGHRSPQGLTMHPTTGAIWETEHGPLGGDEINVIKPGVNYGWPLVTFGRDYDGTTISDTASRPDLEPPFIYFVPSLGTSGITFYTGDRFPQWKGNAFIGAMVEGRTSGTGHVRRITFNERGQPIQREPILAELHQRIRDVRQGPDGLLYVLTDEDAGAVLRVEPAQ